MEKLEKNRVLIKHMLACFTAMALIFSDIPAVLSAGSSQVILITKEEAALSEAPPEEKIEEKLLEKKPAQGPLVVLNSPKNGERYHQPIKVDILFVSRGKVAIDLSSLKVIYVKIFDIDITERVKPYATDKGIQIPEAELPAGKHKLKILLADMEGNVSIQKLVFRVQ